MFINNHRQIFKIIYNRQYIFTRNKDDLNVILTNVVTIFNNKIKYIVYLCFILLNVAIVFNFII